ncbi:Ig-like domain-containing protein [Myxococcus faecalis]|uniref:Ig-like domain-containing protein n=1 Tax=Myxococcus faecalis TaxID=3115646 RepID=UPI003CF939BB
MRFSNAATLLATCTLLALTGCDNDDPTPTPPDGGTTTDAGPDAGDTAPPTVTGTTPAADAVDVAPGSAITVRFSEPVQRDSGTVRAADGDVILSLETGHWEDEGRTLIAHPTQPLRAGAKVDVTVERFEDLAGNRQAAAYSFSFQVGADVARPHVVASNPAEGATGVLPVQTYKVGTSTTLRRLVTVTFNEKMDVAEGRVTLRDESTPANAPRSLTGTWSEDALTLTVSIPRPESDLPPLEEESRYSVDLTQLRNEAGHALDTSHASLGDGRLDFTTGKRDGVTEHACGHALLEAPVAVTAGASPTAMYPATDAPHEFYELTLPANGGAFLGYSEVVSDERDRPVILYLNQDVPIVVHDVTDAETVVPSTVTPAPQVCLPAITHTLKFTAPAGDRFLRLTYGPTPLEKFTFVFERY